MTLSNAPAGALVAFFAMTGCAMDGDYSEEQEDDLLELDQWSGEELGEVLEGPALADPGENRPESQIATVAAWRGEWFPINPGYPNAIGYGWDSWDGAFRQLNWTGGGAATIVVPRDGWYRTRVRVAGSTCDGYPRIQVCFYARCDAFSIGPGWSHQVGTWQWRPGGYGGHVSVYFENDYARAGCDRNIWLDHVWVEAY